MLDIKNLQRRFRKHQRRTKEIYAFVNRNWDREIFSVDKWETHRKKKLKDKKAGKDPFDLMMNIDHITRKVKKNIVRYIIGKAMLYHVLAKLKAGN